MDFRHNNVDTSGGGVEASKETLLMEVSYQLINTGKRKPMYVRFQ